MSKKILVTLMAALLLACNTISAFALEDPTYEYVETGETVDVDQTYSLAAATKDYTDSTRVKVAWEITKAAITYGSSNVWDGEQMKWVETKDAYASVDGAASFTITNYSSTNVKATPTFTKANGMDDAVTSVEFSANYKVVRTPVTHDVVTYEDSDFTNLAEAITATVKVDADEFADLADTTSDVLGTYTISLTDAMSQATIDDIKATYTADATTVPEGFTINKTGKTIEIADAESMLYYGLVYDNAAAVAAGNVTSGSSVLVTDDIDFEYMTVTNGFAAQNPIDGQGHTMENLFINGTKDVNAAFFNTFNASIQGFVLDNIHVTVDPTSTADAAIMSASGSVHNCTVTNSSVVGGKYTAAVLAHCYGHATNCTVQNVSIQGSYKCGTIAAYTEGSSVAVDNNSIDTVAISALGCEGIGKDHYEIGYIVGDWNADAGSTLDNNTYESVTITNLDASHNVVTDAGMLVGYFDQALE